MTTAAMVLGVLPLLLADGAGAKVRFAIGLVIASGMSIGTLFTLFVVPAMYVLMAQDHTETRASQGSPDSLPLLEAGAGNTLRATP